MSQGPQSSKSLPCHCPDPRGLPCGLGPPVPKEDALVGAPRVCVCDQGCPHVHRGGRRAGSVGWKGIWGEGCPSERCMGISRRLCAAGWGFGVSVGLWGIREMSVGLQGGLRGCSLCVRADSGGSGGTGWRPQSCTWTEAPGGDGWEYRNGGSAPHTWSLLSSANRGDHPQNPTPGSVCLSVCLLGLLCPRLLHPPPHIWPAAAYFFLQGCDTLSHGMFFLSLCWTPRRERVGGLSWPGSSGHNA